MDNEKNDAGRNGRTRLARPHSQARTGTGEITFFPVQLTTSRVDWQHYSVDPYAMYITCDDHAESIVSNVWLAGRPGGSVGNLETF